MLVSCVWGVSLASALNKLLRLKESEANALLGKPMMVRGMKGMAHLS
jgi:hypothetical protein